jgi:hypothetical protein
LRRDRILWIILAVGAVLRFFRISGDLPYVLHYDEPTLIDNAVWLIQHKSLNPHFLNYPTGLIYLLALLFGVLAAGGALAGRFDGWSGAVAWLTSRTYPQPAEGGVLYFYPTIGVSFLYLIGRSVSAIAGLATIWIVYAIVRAIADRGPTSLHSSADPALNPGAIDEGGGPGRTADGRLAARIAALAVAVSPLAVEHSRLATTDMTSAALGAACLLAILSAEGSAGRARPWIVAGALGGLAAGVKYNAGLVVFALALLAVWRSVVPSPDAAGTAGSVARHPAVLQAGDPENGPPDPAEMGRRPWKESLRLLAIAAASAVIAFLAVTPYAILDTARFRRDLGYEARRIESITPSFTGAEAVEATALEKMATFFWHNLGVFGLAAALWGAVLVARGWRFRGRHFGGIAVLATALVTLLPLLRWHSIYARYVLLAWPAILVLASIGIVDVASRATRRLGAVPRSGSGTWIASIVPAVALTVLVLAPGTIRLARLEARFGAHDPRIAMDAWIRQNVPPGEGIVTEPGGAFPNADRNSIQRMDFLGRWNPDEYRARGVRYLIGTGREKLIAGKAPFRDVLVNLEAIRSACDVAWSQGHFTIYRLRGDDWQDAVRRAVASGDMNGARTTLEEKVKTRSGNVPFAWRTLAEVRAQTGDTLGSAEAWFQASQLDSADVVPLLALGQIALDRGEWDKALMHLNHAVRIAPRDPLTSHNLAVAYLYRASDRVRGGDARGARADWGAALERARLCAKVSPGDPAMIEIQDQVMRMGRRWGFAAP